jgi:YidC/Oxa1 family membrane protein insertase
VLDTILAPLEYLVSAILLGVHAVLGPLLGRDSGWSWGPSIVVLVVVIRICLIPLFVRQIRAQRNLQLLQPRMLELRKKYGHDRQRQSEEMMKLYKETGTNPLSSCLPILAQSPFFFGLYRVLSGIANDTPRGLVTEDYVESARKAKIFGAPLSDSFLNADTSVTRIVTVVMIVAMCTTQFITQRQIMLKNMPGGSDNPMAQQQKILLYVFPLIFAVSGVYFPVGVLLYWLTTNLWTMGQQFYVIRRMPAPGSKAEEAYQARQRAKGRGAAAEPAQPPAPAPAAPRQQPKRQSRTQRNRRSAGSPAGTGGTGPRAEGPSSGGPSSGGPSSGGKPTTGSSASGSNDPAPADGDGS